MKISEMIERLKEIEKERGDLKIVLCEEHEYWGEICQEIDRKHHISVRKAQPKGPKSGESEICVVIGP